MSAAATPTRPKAAIRKAVSPVKAVAVAEVDEYSPARIKAAFDIVEGLLNHAHATDEAHDWSGDSDRLLRIAHQLADKASASPPAGADIDRVAYDIAALIRAARLVPGDSESPERKALIDQAAVQLNWLTGCDKAGSDCCDPGVPRPAAPGRESSQPLHVAASAPVATEKAEHFAVTAWYRARESQEVIYACVENYGGPETLWGLHTIMKVCVETLAGLQDGVTESGCQDSSNLLAQSIALASLLSEDVNGNPWEMLLDAGLSLMVLAKDVLDKGWEALP